MRRPQDRGSLSIKAAERTILMLCDLVRVPGGTMPPGAVEQNVRELVPPSCLRSGSRSLQLALR